MASVYQRGDTWYLRYKDGRGQWRSIASSARTKTEAKRMVSELEMRAERQRLGLEMLPPEDGGGTVAELFEWWLETYVKGTPSYQRTVDVVGKNFLQTDFATFRLIDVTPGRIEQHLQSRAGELSPDSLNHLRSFLMTAFTRARQAERWLGQNPVKDVRRRKVPKRLPDFLRAEEVPRVLAALAPYHRPLFATAIYTGLRKGELAGLHKIDVDLKTGLINVCYSYERDTTKSNKAAAIPIAAELRPYLEEAKAGSTSDLMFPGKRKPMMTTSSPLEQVLRGALARAGIVLGYTHVCRKRGCGYSEEAPDNELRRCPTHGHKLWPKARVRPIRFHDLRHTTASLLMMAGANPAAVQRILRHSDPRITTEVYGHLVPGYLQDEVDRLKFGAPSNDWQPVAEDSSQLVTPLLQDPETGTSSDTDSNAQPPMTTGVQSEKASVFLPRLPLHSSVGHIGIEPIASGLRVRCSTN